MNRVHSMRPISLARSTFLPLRLQRSRRSKGQRYYPRPTESQSPLMVVGRGVERPSCVGIRITQPGHVL